MSDCTYHDICGLPDDADPEAQLCILHSHNPDKDTQAFAKTLEVHRKDKGAAFEAMVFPERADFTGSTFTQGAHFEGATFTGEAIFRGATFTQGAHFEGATFTGAADFDRATFTFEGATFTQSFYLGGATRTFEVANLFDPDNTFTQRTDFSRATFTQGADFSGATFTQWAIFRGATFTGEADFGEATFTERASFSATFTEEADFRRATFTGEALFEGATFTQKAIFSRATFTQRADFGRVTFTGGAYFGEATFTGEALFEGATFTKLAYFNRVTFTQRAIFSRTTFTGVAYFGRATFLSEIVLDTARFSPEAGLSFRDSRFQGRMIFTAGQEASQEEPPDEGRMIAVFTNAQQVDFCGVVIEPPDALTFIGTDFTRCQFLGMDLRKVQLVGVTWPVRRNRVVVYDEIVPLKEGETCQWDQIERLYRQLKQNYEDQRDYQRAGDFHYGEKEMQRHNPQTPRRTHVLLWLYWLVSGYGERIGRPLLCAGVLFVVATCGYLWLGLTPKGAKTPLALNSVWDWITVMHYCFRVMTFLRPTDLVPLGIAKYVHTIQSLLGPLFIGLFALAVRQRLKR